MIEEMTYHRYNDAKDLVRLLGICFLEHFPYHPLNSIWRARGIWQFLTGKNAWQMIERVGFAGRPGAPANAGSCPCPKIPSGR